ncbi:MAG: GNVR domain-containing protein, partial [Pirellulales bacterium]
LTLAVLLYWPRSFRSEAKLFVRVGRETVGLDPTATTGQTVNVQMNRAHEINSVVEMLQSRAMLERVVKRVTPEEILSRPERNWLVDLCGVVGTQWNDLKGLFQKEDASDAEGPSATALRHLLGIVTVDAAKDSAIISIGCKAQTPDTARKIVAALVVTYLQEHPRLNNTAGSADFFEDQAEEANRKLRQMTEQLHEAKNEKEIISIDGERERLEREKSEIEEQLALTDREIAGAQASTRTLKTIVESMESVILAGRIDGNANSAAEGMREKLYDLEIQERALLEKYSAQHPLVLQVRRQVAEVRKIHEAQPDSRTESSFELNANRQQLELDLAQEQALLAKLTATNSELTRQREDVLAELRDLNAYTYQLEELQRKIDMLDESYRAYSKNLEQARIDSEIERQKITNVNVVQEATLEKKPVSPQKRLVAGFGLILAIFGSTGLALVCDAVDQRFRSPAEIEKVLDLPVLISLPQSARQRAHV